MRRAVLLLGLLLVVTVTVPAVAGELEDKLDKVGADMKAVKAQIDSARGERTDIAEQILETDRRLQKVVGDLEAAEADLSAVEADIATTTEQLATIRSQLAAQYAALETTRLELSTKRAEARRRALRIYMGGGQDLGTMVFAAEQVTDLSVGLQYASEIMHSTETLIRGLETLSIAADRQAEIIEDREAELEEQAAHLDSQRGVLEGLAAQVEQRKAEVEKELAEQQALLAEVRHDIAHFEDELAKLEREEARVQQLIREQQSSGGTAPGVFVRPVPGGITSPFGYRIHPIYGTRRLHAGVDMSAGYGTPIAAAASGRVILSAYYGGYGNTVIVDHGGGISTLYAHQSRIAVSSGQSVDAGQTIGYVGSTGLSTGAHLHFEVRKLGTPIDPMPFL